MFLDRCRGGRLAALLVATGLAGCPRPQPAPGQAAPPCPAEAPGPPLLPHEAPQHTLPEFWLQGVPDPDRELISPAQIEEHNRRMASIVEAGWPAGRWELEQLRLEPERVRARLQGRLGRLRQAAQRGQRVLAGGERPEALLASLGAELSQLQPADELRVVLRSTALRCFPTEQAVYEKAWDLAFDLMQCAQLRYGEPVRVAARLGRFFYVWSTYADGWVRPEDLSGPLAPEEADRYQRPPRFVVVQEDRLPIWADPEGRVLLAAAPFGQKLPLLAEERGRLAVQTPGRSGLVTGWIRSGPERAGAPEDLRDPTPAGVSIGYPALSRSALLTRAFRLLHTPYGWGGTGDKRDCSRLMMDLFGAFGLRLPRNTSHQKLAGTRHLEVAELSEAARAAVIEAEARRAVVLLYHPGHIMLYLGRDGDQLYAFHLFSGYLTPCRPRGETMQRVNRTLVTSLELGRGGSRRAFIERITRLVLIDGSDQLKAAR